MLTREGTASGSTPKRRRFQYSLRACLLVVTAFALVCPWLAERYHQWERETRERECFRLRRQLDGATAARDKALNTWRLVNAEQTTRDDWTAREQEAHREYFERRAAQRDILRQLAEYMPIPEHAYKDGVERPR